MKSDSPLVFEKLVFQLTLLAAVAFSLIRINSVDTPWHLATARLALENGYFPATNTFSYTHPDYPLYQQYPVYQSILYAAYRVGGWEALSLLHCGAWVLIFLLWIRWGGSWQQAMVLHLPWTFCLWCLQQRMILRPDIATILLFLALLNLFDGYRSGKRWSVWPMIVVQWLMANSHQLFTIGLAAQVIFIIHLVMVRLGKGRLGISTEDIEMPVWPLLVALVLSAGSMLLTPLGTKIVGVFEHTASSLYHHRGDVDEFAYFYTSRWAIGLFTISCILGLIGFWKSRRCWRPFEAGLWVMSAALAVAALRGIVFFGPVSVAIFARSWSRTRTARTDESESPTVRGKNEPLPLRALPRLAAVGVTLGLCLLVFWFRWVAPPRILGGTQPGIGRSFGDWPDQTVQFLRENPPPGRMLNLGWYSGNFMIWELFPQHKVFVDPRFEAYPREFLLAAIQAERDDRALDELLERYDPQWLVAEVRLTTVMQRVGRLLQSKQWQLVFGDTNLLVLVRVHESTAEYRSKHAIALEDFEPTDWLTDHPDLLAQQQARMRHAYQALGRSKPDDTNP